jgi:glycosyltransferase involved in cell wall biosynthesis
MNAHLSEPRKPDALRLGMVAPSLDILGGQGIAARSLAQALEGEGVKVFFVPVNPRFPPGLGWLRKIPVARTLFNQCLYVASLLRLRHVDVVHVFAAAYWSFVLAPLPAIVVGRLFGKKVVLNYHSGEAADHLAHWGWLVHPWVRLASMVVVPSAYLQQAFDQHGHATKVVRNFIDLSAFRYRERRQLRPVLLSNRNLEAHYGVFNSLEAYVLLKQRVPEATLTIAGYGSQLKLLRQRVAEQGIKDVTIVGRVEPRHMPALYEQADIFVNSSLIDNQPISILEALAAGLPIVTTPTGDIAAMVQHGQCGTMVPVNDPQAMADAMQALLDAGPQAAELAKRGRAAVASYTWPQVYQAWMDVYVGNECETATDP